MTVNIEVGEVGEDATKAQESLTVVHSASHQAKARLCWVAVK